MDFRQFLDGSWKKVLYLSLTINDVSSMIGNELHGAKIKALNYRGSNVFSPSIKPIRNLAYL
jgi:hypothetical protein